MILHTKHAHVKTRDEQPTVFCCDFHEVLLAQVDGMDVLSVREAVKFAADLCRAGKVSRLEYGASCSL